jgi:Domain of unknown function (DUF4476)
MYHQTQLLFTKKQKLKIMKQIITILVLVVLSTQLFAYNGAVLKIRDAEGRQIAISINGRKFQQTGRVVTINNVPPGLNKIKVYQYRQYQNGFRKADLIYTGNVNIQPNYIYRCTVDDYEGMDVRSFCCVNQNGGYSYQGNGNNNNAFGDYNDMDHDWDDNYWGNTQNGWQDHHQQQGEQAIVPNGGYNNGNNGGYNNGNYNNGNNGNYNNGNNGGYNNGNYNNGNNGGYNNGNYNNGNNGNFNNGGFNNGNNGVVMNQQAFQAFKQTVANSKFDSGKQTIVKTQLQNTWISTNQLIELVALFDFESSKLDIAKVGAAKVIDKQNLFNVYNSFDYESSKTDFAAFINTLK